MSTELATAPTHSTGMQVALPQAKIELLKTTICKGATDDELQLFIHAAERTGLDPFMKQIHAVKRWDAKSGREMMSIQTGIDGYRLIADRTGKYAGNDEPVFVMDKGALASASVTVWKMIDGQRCPFSATARWTEYVQTKKDGTPGPMWSRMPYVMLGKCAEALALRKAFPAELSGVYTHDEMQQADSEAPTAAVRPAVKAPQMKQTRPEPQIAAPDVIESEVIEQPAELEDLSPPEDPGALSRTISVAGINKKTTKKPNCFRYIITSDEGVNYATFDEKLAQFAKDNPTCVVFYEEGQYGNTITEIRKA